MKCPNCGEELTELFENIYKCGGCHKIFTPSSFAKRTDVPSEPEPEQPQPQSPVYDTPVDTVVESPVAHPVAEPAEEPIAKPVEEPSSEPVEKPIAEPSAEPVAQSEEIVSAEPSAPQPEPVVIPEPPVVEEPLVVEEPPVVNYTEPEPIVQEQYVSVPEEPVSVAEEPACANSEPADSEPSQGAVCPRCGASVHGRFCPKCGYDINKSGAGAVIECPVCKHDVPADAKFCTHCGWRVGVRHNVVNDIKYSKPVTATKDFFQNNEHLHDAVGFLKTHKKLTAIISAAVLVVIIAAIVLGAVLGSTTGRLNRIGFSSSIKDVKRIMGTPDEIDETSSSCLMTWYYGVADADEAMEAAFSDKSFGMAEIMFRITDEEEKLSYIYYSPDCLEDDEEKSTTLEQDSFYQYGDKNISDCWYRVDFSHGGYYKALIGSCYVDYNLFTAQEITLRDAYGLHTAEIRIIEGKGPNYEKYLEESLLNDEDFTIEKTDDGFNLTGLKNTSLSSITIPDGVTSIGYNAFYNCTSLTDISISDSVTNISNSAFCQCRNLSSVNIPNGVTNIGNWTFADCDALTLFVIPDNVTSIGDNAFRGCDGLSDITIPNSVTSIGDYAFYGCNRLTDITIPDSVTSIGIDAFGSCSNLERIYVSYNNPNYSSHDGILYNKGKTEFVAIPNNLQGSINIPYGITTIEGFGSCTELTSITLPNSVTSIGVQAFAGCFSLSSITLPDSVRNINRAAFHNCSSLTYISIPYGVKSIGDEAFQNCSALTDIVIPDSVTNIGQHAFSGCSQLSNVSIGNGVTSISDYAFYECYYLSDIIIPNSVTSIGLYAFSNCSGLSDITIGNSVTSIGNNAFYCCRSLTAITIPDSVTRIGTLAFSGCGNLTSVEFEDPSDWYRVYNLVDFSNKVNGNSIDLSNSSFNAGYLRYTYEDYYFYKK